MMSNDFGMILGFCWDGLGMCFWVILGLCWDGGCTILGWFVDEFGVMFASFGAVLG